MNKKCVIVENAVMAFKAAKKQTQRAAISIGDPIIPVANASSVRGGRCAHTIATHPL
jgi:hypothetical protein